MKIHCPTCKAETLIGSNGCCSWCDTQLDKTRAKPTRSLTSRTRPTKDRTHG